MAKRKEAKLRAGQRVWAALSVRYVADESHDSMQVEAVEFLFEEDSSVLLSCGTDWALKITEGRWSELPEWCWPVESWAFEKIGGIGGPGLDIIVSTADILNVAGEICGVQLEFSVAWVVVRSGEVMTWDIIRKES